MFGIEALDVVIGLIFIYLLFSLFVSIVNEIISTALNLKGRHLFDSFQQFVTDDGIKKLSSDARIKLLLKGKADTSDTIFKNDGSNFPEFIPQELFGEILEDEVKQSLTNIDATKEQLIDSYDIVVAKARASYKKNIQLITFFIGLLVTVMFNVDSISIFSYMANNPESAALISEQASDFITTVDSIDDSSVKLDSLIIKLESLSSEQIDKLEPNLGIGWDTNAPKNGLGSYFILGWIITSLALSMGAPFWYDLLGKVIRLKNEIKKTGSTPETSNSINKK